MKNHPILSWPRYTEDERGFTLLELMVASVVGMVVVAAAFTILTTTSKAVRANDQVVDTQQNTRIAMDLIVGDIKVAGFGLAGQPVGTQIGGCKNLGGPFGIIPADNIPTGADKGADAISLVVPTTSALWKLKVDTGVAGFNKITLAAGGGQSIVDAGLDTTAVATAMISINGALTAQVKSRSGDDLTLTDTVTAPAQFLAGAPIYLLQCIRYEVGTPAACSSNGPCLMRGTVAPNGTASLSPMVDGIEDIQFAYACDGCLGSGIPDRIIDDQGTPSGTFDQADFLTNETWQTTPKTPDKIRLIQVSVVGRQVADDQGFGENVTTKALSSSSALQVSDHTQSADASYNAATYPQYRRRVLIKTVETRNVGIEG